MRIAYGYASHCRQMTTGMLILNKCYCYLLNTNKKELLTFFLFQSGMYLWLTVFWLQPHKEERFLFPVYPLICLAAAISLDTRQRLFSNLVLRSRDYLHTTVSISAGFILVFAILSLSRITALYQVVSTSWRLGTQQNGEGASMRINLVVNKLQTRLCH